MGTVEISEIFYSLQGEGTLAGEPTTFIRFQGCSLGCIWCDTKYSWKPGIGKLLTVEEIVQIVEDITPKHVKWICITGGEPLQQPEGFEELLGQLCSKTSYKVEVETSGLVSIPKEIFGKVDSWVVDIKGPSSGCKGGVMEDLAVLRPQDQVKMVVETKEDLSYLDSTLRNYPTKAKVLISPFTKVNDTVSPALLLMCANYCKSRGFRLSIQLHKLIWGVRRGI